MKLKVAEIIVDESVYPRNQLDHFQVRRLTDAMQSGAKLPPIVVCAKTKRLVDGRHRLQVHIDQELDTIDATLKEYKNDAELFADAVRLNVGHGVTLDNYDIKRAAAKLVEMGFEAKAISELVRIPLPKLEKMALLTATGSDGAPVVLKGGLSHLKGQTLSYPQAEAVERYGGMKVTFYVKQLVMVLENNMWPHTVAFRDAMDRIVELWEERPPKAKTESAA